MAHSFRLAGEGVLFGCFSVVSPEKAVLGRGLSPGNGGGKGEGKDSFTKKKSA